MLNRSSLTTRRFPALRSLTNEDVEVFVLPPEQTRKHKPPGKGAHLFDPDVVKPTAVSSLGPNRRGGGTRGATYEPLNSSKPANERPPFRPCNPSEARESISLWRTGYIELHSPYDLSHRLMLLEIEEANKKAIQGTFIPNAPSQARESMKVNYFLTSPDAEKLEAERRYIKEKAAKNMNEYLRRMRTQRVATES
jgi:hypothetical protein